jgi:hypothetical protein
MSGDLGSRAQQAADTAAEKMGGARDAAADKLGQVRERASELKATLADRLEAGAERLRSQGQGQTPAYAGAPGDGATAAAGDRMNQLSGTLASGMQSTATWLRDADLDSMKSGIERQVREHPGRSLLVAVGLGYLIGKAIRR